MKKLIALLLVAMPFYVAAQKIQIGLNAGMQVWTKAGTDVYGALRFISDNEFTQGGFVLEGGKSSENVSLPYIDKSGQDMIYKDRSNISYINPNLFMNLKLPVDTRFYAGGTIGYFIIWQNAYYYTEVNATPAYTEITKVADPRRTVSLGAQIGYTSKISERLNFNAETAVRLVPLNITRQICFPFSIGLQYKIANK